MDNREAVNWLINISADIGKAEHSDLWHYEQALTEIKDMLESAQPEPPCYLGSPCEYQNPDVVISQPEERTDKRTESHACDLISRQAAIRWVKTECNPYGNPTLDFESGKRVIKHLEQMPPAQPEQPWIPCSERLPDNAVHSGAFCPRYQVMTEFGVTEGWYRPYDNGRGGCWYALFWFMLEQFEIWNVDFERGCVPKVIENTRVLAWRPMPEAYTED